MAIQQSVTGRTRAFKTSKNQDFANAPSSHSIAYTFALTSESCGLDAATSADIKQVSCRLRTCAITPRSSREPSKVQRLPGSRSHELVI